MPSASETPGLPLTGERTVPGIERENYWFRRHEVVYAWIADTFSMPGKTVVEAGCGEGYGAELMRTAGGHVIALDYDEATIGHVRNRYPEVTSIRANLDQIPLPDTSVDLLVSLQVLEHLWDVPRFLSEVRRVLRPGGQVVISTPNRLTFSPGLGRGEQPTNPFHVEEFDGPQLAELLAENGFGSVDVQGLHQGERLQRLAADSGDIVARQVEAIIRDEDWPADLLADVASVRVEDFEVGPMSDAALDLIATAVR